MRALQIHPACEIIPEMDPATFAGLLSDIKENGVKVPIWLYDGKILDGRNRYRACRELGIDCPTIETHGDIEKDVVSLNVIRRHLDESQRQLIGARMANITHRGQPKKNSANLQNNSVSVAQAAKIMNVSPRGIEAAKTVLREGGPGLVAAVVSGRMSVSKAAKAVGHSKKGPPPPVKRTPLPKRDELKEDALWLWGQVKGFQERGILERDPDELMEKMLPVMVGDMLRLVPTLIGWLEKFPTKGRKK